MTVGPQEIAGRYRLDRRLGAGGMSTVYRARDTVLERAVAVKLLAEHLAHDAPFVARFQREARAAARLQHPNVVQVFDSGLDSDTERHFIVMELVEGPSCADILRDRKRAGVEETAAIVRDACHGLAYAHRAGVVHRDVKPGNLLIAEESGTTKLADFGIAKAAAQTRITQVGSVLGTAAYLSPEQAHGEEAGPPADLYSLGVCAYQLLTGRLPHEYGSLTELALKQQEEPIEPISERRSEVPPELDAAIAVALANEPDDRYATALDFAAAVEAGLHGQATEVTRRLVGATAIADTDVTRSLNAATDTSEPLPTWREPPTPTRPAPRHQPSVAEQQRRTARNRRLARFFTLLAIVFAIVAAGLVLLANESGQTDISPVDRDTVQEQIEGIEQFLRQNTR